MRKYWQSLYPWVRPQLPALVLTMILALPLGLIKGYQTYIIKDLFDHGFAADADSRDAILLALTLIGLQLLNYPFRFFHFFWIKVISEKIANAIRLALYRHLMQLPLAFHQKQKQGEMLSIIQSDVAIVAESVRFFPGLIREPLNAICLLGVAIYHDWRLTLIILGGIPFFILIFNYTGKKIRQRVTQVQQAIARVTHILSEGLSGQKMIKANNLQDYSNLRLQKSQENYLKTYEKCASIEEQSNPLIEIVASVALAGVIIYAHERITHGQLTTGAFVSFMAAMAFFMDPVRKFTDSNIKMQRGLGSFDRLTHFLGEPVEKNTSTYQHPTLQSEINIENLSFSYGDQKVLQNFSLKIHKGQKVALVGLSGSGKSTLINLLLRFYPTTTGKISLDGRDITDFELENYRRLYALVSQDLFLFNETILENLTTGQSFDENKLWNALSTAHAKDFIQQLPEKLETPIGDRGLRLSGGQAQRVTIARAVLRDAPILLFDEATSALDNESEKIVQEAIDKISGNKTVITVAHRLSTIQNYDKIVVLKDGKKVEEGTHQELVSLGGEYKKLYDLGNR